METLRSEGIVVDDSVEFVEHYDSRGHLVKVRIEGRVSTASGAVLAVEKWLEVRHRHRAEVRTIEYAYHAFLRRSAGEVDLFRYDNCDGGLETLHRHHFDSMGNETHVLPIDHEQLPFLSEIIKAAHDAAA